MVETAELILNSYEFSYDFAPFLVPPPFPLPPGFPPLDVFNIFAELHVNTYSSGMDIDGNALPFGSTARMSADQSAFIQMDVISANGYNYPGRPNVAVDPPPGAVPEPSSLALLALALAGLLGGAARRRTR